jgi:hypothetical protein
VHICSRVLAELETPRKVLLPTLQHPGNPLLEGLDGRKKAPLYSERSGRGETFFPPATRARGAEVSGKGGDARVQVYFHRSVAFLVALAIFAPSALPLILPGPNGARCCPCCKGGKCECCKRSHAAGGGLHFSRQISCPAGCGCASLPFARSAPFSLPASVVSETAAARRTAVPQAIRTHARAAEVPRTLRPRAPPQQA